MSSESSKYEHAAEIKFHATFPEIFMIFSDTLRHLVVFRAGERKMARDGEREGEMSHKNRNLGLTLFFFFHFHFHIQIISAVPF